MVLQNSGAVTGGATGISLIPRPWFFGLRLPPRQAATYIYYIAVALVALTVFVVRRIEDSRVGRALEAMREDEIACEAMGVDLVRNKLVTFSLGAFWAGIAGVLLAAQTTYINPDSFTLWESITVLMAVVIGGTGSIPGAIGGALLLKLLPEYFRPLAQYRMLIVITSYSIHYTKLYDVRVRPRSSRSVTSVVSTSSSPPVALGRPSIAGLPR